MSPKNQPSPSADYDIQLLFPVLFLVGIGIVMVYSASSALALKKFGSDYLFLKKQALFALIGIVGLVAERRRQRAAGPGHGAGRLAFRRRDG